LRDVYGIAKFGVETIRDKYVNGKKTDRELPAIRQLTMSIDVKGVYRYVSRMLQLDSSLSKKITIYLCHRYCGMKLKQIGNYFNITESAVSEASRRFNVSLKRSKELKAHVETARKSLNLWNV